MKRGKEGEGASQGTRVEDSGARTMGWAGQGRVTENGVTMVIEQ